MNQPTVRDQVDVVEQRLPSVPFEVDEKLARAGPRREAAREGTQQHVVHLRPIGMRNLMEQCLGLGASSATSPSALMPSVFTSRSVRVVDAAAAGRSEA